MTPQEFAAKIKAKYPGAYDNVPDAELAQKVVEKYPVYKTQVNFSAAPAESNPVKEVTPNLGENTATEMQAGGQKIVDSVSRAADKFNQAGDVFGENGGKALAGKVGALTEGALGSAAGAVQTIFAPLTATVKTITDKLASTKAVQDVAQSKPVSDFLDKVNSSMAPLQKLAETHPDAARNIVDGLNVALTALGDKIPVLDTPVGEVASSIKNSAVDLANKIPEGVTGPGDQRFAQAIVDANKKSAVKKATDLVKSTQETMTKNERLAAADEGRLRPTKLGGKEFMPSETEKNAGDLLAGKVSGNPVKDLPVIKSEIATRGSAAEKYLTENAQKITNQEHADMFGNFRKEAEKVMTDSEIQAYDEQVKLFSKQLQGRGGYNTANYYKALKEYENNVASRLPRGKDALLDPTGIASAKIRAAADIRKIVRDMIGSKNPEFKGRMYDLASLYDAKDNVAIKADKLEGNAIERASNKIKNNPVKSALGTVGASYLIKKIVD